MLVENSRDTELNRQDNFRAKWLQDRLSVEECRERNKFNPDTPLMVEEALNFQAHVLDVFLARLPGRAKDLGEEEVRSAYETIATAEMLIKEVQRPPSLKGLIGVRG